MTLTLVVILRSGTNGCRNPHRYAPPPFASYDSWESLVQQESQPDSPEVDIQRADSVSSDGIPDLVSNPSVCKTSL